MAALRLASTHSSIKPSVARSFACALLAVTSASVAGAQDSSAAPSLTENEVLVRVLGRAALNDVLEGTVVAEEGRARGASAYPNPQLSYMREQTFGAFGTAENYLSVAQTVDIGNRRGLASQAGDARSRAARRDGDAVRLSVAADARQRFYELLYRRRRVAALESWAAHVTDALTIVTRREQRGDVATYDRRRLERERAVAAARLGAERAALAGAEARLQALLGTEISRMSIAGTLLPDSDPKPLQTLRASSSSRPDVRALDLQIEAASLDRNAASRWWLPDLRLEGGWKGVNLGSGGRTDGFLLGASFSLPLWDRSSGLARIAEGEARAARGRRALIAAEFDGEFGGAREEAVQLRRTASEFREQTNSASGVLVRMTSAGYEGGELGVLELLDAYRGAADDELTALDMEQAARRARIELDRLTGAGIP